MEWRQTMCYYISMSWYVIWYPTGLATWSISSEILRKLLGEQSFTLTLCHKLCVLSAALDCFRSQSVRQMLWRKADVAKSLHMSHVVHSHKWTSCLRILCFGLYCFEKLINDFPLKLFLNKTNQCLYCLCQRPCLSCFHCLVYQIVQWRQSYFIHILAINIEKYAKDN